MLISVALVYSFPPQHLQLLVNYSLKLLHRILSAMGYEYSHFSTAMLWQTLLVFYLIYLIPNCHASLTNRSLIFFNGNMYNFQKYISQPPLITRDG